MIITLEELQKIYLEKFYQKSQIELFPEVNRTLDIPVNLNVYDSYYKSHNQYTYLEKYSFKDLTYVFDSRSNFNDIDYKRKEDWLKDISFDNKRNFVHGNSEEISFVEFADWSKKGDNNLSLFDAINIDLRNRKTFSPMQKNLYLKYDYLHTSGFNEYSFYFKDRKIENIHSKVNFGKQGVSTKNIEDLLIYGANLPAVDKCYHSRNMEIRNNINVFEDGYYGICDRKDWGGYHYAFPYSDTIKWTTPYVSYGFQKLNYYQNKHMYATLGEFVNFKSNSKNLVSDSEKEQKENNLWFIDYDDIFLIKYDSKLKTLNVDLDITKVPTNFEDFLKISSILDFELRYFVNRKEEIFSFNIKDVLDKNAKIQLKNDNKHLFSSFKISVKSNSKNVILADKDLEKYVYEPNISLLKKSGNIYKDIEFRPLGIEKHFPSEFLNKNLFKDYFYLVSNLGSKHKINDEVLEDLKINMEFNDVDGTLSISYYLNGEVQEKFIDDLKRLPDFYEITKEFNSKEAALQFLKLQNPEVSDYFWNNIDFYSNDEFSYTREKNKFLIGSKRNHNLVKNQWDSLDHVNIYLPNENYIFPVFKKNILKNSNSLSDLFEINNNARSKGLKKEDFIFEKIDERQNDEKILIKVKLDKQKNSSLGINEELSKFYFVDYYDVFSKTDEVDEKLNLTQNEKELDSSYLDKVEKVLWGTSGALFLSGLVLSNVKKIPFIGKRFFN